MPIYEYRCAGCGHEFELLVFGNKTVLCPACKSPEVVKKISAFGVSGVEKQTSSSGCGSCSKSSCSSCG